jgi:hypothetical protein
VSGGVVAFDPDGGACVVIGIGDDIVDDGDDIDDGVDIGGAGVVIGIGLLSGIGEDCADATPVDASASAAAASMSRLDCCMRWLL